MSSDIKLNGNAVLVEGNLALGTSNPARPMHVETGEIHSGGVAGGFSFSDRAKPAFVDTPQKGERWVWYAHEGSARLWSGRDILVVDKDGRRDGGLPSLDIPGDLHVGGKLSGGHVSRLDGNETTLGKDGKAYRRISCYANMISFNGSAGKPEKYGLHTDFDNGKEVLVLNFPENPYGKRFKDGVRVEGNLQVNGVVTQSSSIALKHDVATLPLDAAAAALQRLRAVTFRYKADDAREQHAGFIAEEVPELVAKGDRTTVSAMDIVAVLTTVVQHLQQTVAAMGAKLEALAEPAK